MLVLVLFLIGDIVAFIGHAAWQNGALSHRFSVYHDRGYPELFGYVTGAAAALLFISAARFSHKRAYLLIAFILILIVLDDSLTLHERFGRHAAEWFNLEPAYNLRAVDFGELMYFLGFGAFAVAVLAAAIFNSEGRARFHAIAFFTLLGLLGVFVVLMDMLHSAINRFGWIEDGGEMIVLSMIAGLAAHAAASAFIDQHTSS